MGIYSRKNLIISVQGPNSLLVKPTTNGEILIFDALLGSFITPPNPDEVQGTNLGNGVPVFDNQVQRELFFNTLVAGDYITINEDNGEITFNVHPAATVVADIPARDALVPYIGQQVFVNDTGNGENAFYIWTGAQWVVFATQDSAATDAQTFTMDVTFNDTSPVILGSVSSGSRAFSVDIQVTQEFDGINPVLTIGHDLNQTAVMTDIENDLTVVDNYAAESNVIFTGPTETVLKAYFNFGGSLQGAAKIIVSYV